MKNDKYSAYFYPFIVSNKVDRSFRTSFIYYFLFFTSIFAFTCVSATELIVVNKSQGLSERHQYSQELLIAALDSTIESHGDYKIESRVDLDLKNTAWLMQREGYGDVIRGATRLEWEKSLIPIKIPLMKGALGLRVLVIRKESQATFSAINSIEELKKQLAGTADYWSITQIFDHHQFNLVKLSRHESMYALLEKKRFEYISRGIYEVLLEYNKYKKQHPSLAIENTLLINIPLPVYFFVNPNKPELAERIRLGLKNIQKNGVFDKIFAQHFREKFKTLNLLDRKILTLINPNLANQPPAITSKDLQTLLSFK